jgi:hypothetical protein
MASDPAQEIRRQMAEARSHLSREVRSLADSAKAKTDWRYYYRKHPWLFIGAAAVVGYLIVPGAGPAVTLGAEALEKMGLSGKSSTGKREKSLAEIAASAMLPVLTRFAISQGTAVWQRFKERQQEPSDGPEPRYSFRPR